MMDNADNVGVSNTPTVPSLSRVAASGIVWLVAQSLGGRLISLFSQLALAWLISPANFGLIGLVYAVTNISASLVNFGIGDVLLQRHKTIRLWSASTFWTSFALGIISFIFVFGISEASSRIYHSPNIVSLALIIASSMPIGALQTVPNVIIRSQMKFGLLSAVNLAELAFTAIAVVGLAVLGYGVYSFALPVPVIAALKLAVLWYYAPVTLTAKFRIKQVKFLMSSGSAVFATKLILSAVSQGDYVLLGLVASQSQVGIYYFAFRLAVQPIWILAGNLIGVLFPTLIQLRTEPSRQIAATMATARVLAYLAMPACFLQAALADPVLKLLFGAKWLSAIPVMELLSIGLPFDAVTWVTGTLLAANREYRRALVYTVMFLPLFVVLVFGGSYYYQSEGTALGVTLYYLILGPAMSCIVLKRYAVPVANVLSLFIKPPVLAGVSMGIAAALSRLRILGGMEVAKIFEITIVGSSLYIALIRWIEPRVLTEIIDKAVPQKIKRQLAFLKARLDKRPKAL